MGQARLLRQSRGEMTRLDLFEVLDKAVSHATTMVESGPLTERSPDPTHEGREPPARRSGAFRIGERRSSDALKGYLVQEAQQKRAAADGICWLGRTLSELSCPADFIRRVEHAAEEKRKHAELLFQLARVAPSDEVNHGMDVPLADLWGLTLEVATSRCVVDTYAAARFAFQAIHANSPELRAAFSDIARQDALHTTLFWDLLDWALSHLSPARARQINEEQGRVRDSLRLAVEAPLPEELHETAGVPDVDAAHALLDVLEFQLWPRVAA